MAAVIVPIDDAGVDETEAVMRNDRSQRPDGSFVITTVGEMLSWIERIRADRAIIAALTAARDAALARAMPEPRLMRTVEEVEALPAGAYLICSRLNRTRAFCAALAPCAERWEVGGRLWPDRTMVGCILSGPLPDLPTPTAGETL